MVRYTRSKDNTTVYAHVLSGFGSRPLPAGGTLPLECVRPMPGSQITLLGYVDEATKLPLPIKWTQQQASSGRQAARALLRVPANLSAHAAVVEPAFVFKIRGAPVECRRGLK